MICIGYVGVEAFDIILYICKTLSALDYPVLIIDLSDTGALTRTIYHGMELDSTIDVIHYRNLNYTRKVPGEKELNEYSNGVVFVVYGLKYIERHPFNLNILNIVVDPFPNNIDTVNQCVSSISTRDIKVRVLVRNIITLDDFERVKGSVLPCHNSHSIRYLYYDINDYENAIRCQMFQDIRFSRISPGMKKLIINEIGDILPSVKPSSIRKAVCLASKGEKLR